MNYIDMVPPQVVFPRIVVPRIPFILREIDLKLLLSVVPPGLLKRMQQALAANAQGFQIGLDDSPGDQVDIILQNALLYARTSTRED